MTDANGMMGDLVEIDAATGAETPMPGRRWRTIRDFTWLPYGSGLILAALEKTAVPGQLWVIAYPGGAVRRISNDLSDYLSAVLSADGHTIAAVQRNLNSALWTARSDTPDNASQVTSGHQDGVNGFSSVPGGRIVYTGNHSSNWDLFIEDADGGNSRQLTFDNRFHTNPSACDDRRTVIYGSYFAKGAHLFKLDLQSGVSMQLTNVPVSRFLSAKAQGIP